MSLHPPQCNGKTESAVTKKMLTRVEEPDDDHLLALLEWIKRPSQIFSNSPIFSSLEYFKFLAKSCAKQILDPYIQGEQILTKHH